MNERESVSVLRECIDLQTKKSADYQSSVSEIKQAEYYPHGVNTIFDIMHAKMLRIKSVLAKMEAGEGVNFESVEDSCKDLINYSSFMVSYTRKKMDGQDPERDVFNRKTYTPTVSATNNITSTADPRWVNALNTTPIRSLIDKG